MLIRQKGLLQTLSKWLNSVKDWLIVMNKSNEDTIRHTTKEAFQNWMSPLNDGSDDVVDEGTGLHCLHVKTLSSLIQAIGYKKFQANKSGHHIYFRGQTELYKCPKRGNQYEFQPSALRGIRNEGALQDAKKFIKQQIAMLRRMNSSLFKDESEYPNDVIEGLLQQYGLKTTWFDVVDNIWVALWFSCYKSVFPVEIDTATKKVSRAFVKMMRRDVNKELGARFAYILLLGDEGAEVVDLRCTLPSMFIRPHVQHGLLIRTAGVRSPNMASLIKGIIRMDLYDALEWLGESRLLTPESMMPPPNTDSGFKQLLASEAENTEEPFIKFPIYS